MDLFDLFSFHYERIKCWSILPKFSHHLFGLTDVQAQDVVVTPANEVLHSSSVGIFIPYNHSCHRRIIGEFHLKGAFLIISTARREIDEQCIGQHTLSRCARVRSNLGRQELRRGALDPHSLRPVGHKAVDLLNNSRVHIHVQQLGNHQVWLNCDERT